MTRAARTQAAVAILMQAARVLLVLAIGFGLRTIAMRHDAATNRNAVDDFAIPLAAVQVVLPQATKLGETPSRERLWQVFDNTGATVGYAGVTLPEAAGVIGYRGPSQVLLVFDASGTKVIGARLLESRDTRDHVDKVLGDQRFFDQFTGLSWQPTTNQHVDAVSGATLTSLAIAEGILVRLGSERPSLRFPDPIELSEVQALWPETTGLVARDKHLSEARDAQDQLLGLVMRTGPLVDAEEGYQGPTELLLGFSPDETLTHIKLRRSYDNDPYVGYVKTEASFWKKFKKRDLDSLQAIDPEAEGIEGVSGATMTSLAVAKTVPQAIRKYRIERTSGSAANQSSGTAQSKRFTVRWSWHDLATGVVLAIALGLSFSSWRGHRVVKLVWRLVLIGYLGLVAGNLLSQALVLGWAQAGIPWRLAPGLTALAAVSLLWPAATKRNVYCHHLCPHGAAQQLVRLKRPAWKPSPRWQYWLTQIPGVLLVLLVAMVALRLPINLAAWEPFDAYLWWIAGPISIILAIGSLVAATRVPMAYCQYGCPTGRLLEYLRRHKQSDRFRFADGVVVIVAVVIWSMAIWME